jgi:hypothetical protein
MRNNPNIVLRGDRNECPTCGELFNSSVAFEKHRRGDFGKNRHCLTTAEMLGAGMAKNSTGWWVTELRGSYDAGQGRDLVLA